MPLDSAWNAYIFRDGKTAVSGPTLVRELADRLLGFDSSPTKQTALIDLLLRAGELECALRDSDSPHAQSAEAITDTIAVSFVSKIALPAEGLARRLRPIIAPDQVQVAVPEGFAYYSLHPLDYVDLVRRAPQHSRHAAIVGIRSIGATLSAIVRAALRADAIDAERITVRPSGHPYNRETRLSPAQQQWVARMLSDGADFFVVDEGPGMSGSSFLSVGDALISTGVPLSQITFLCSRQPDPASLTAANAAERWPQFNACYTEPTRHLPREAKHYVAGGIWRARAFPSENEWPSSWLQMERLKFLSADENRIFRFEGFGRFGGDVYDRATKVADAGFGPMPAAREAGFGVYPVLPGRYLSPADATEEVILRLAEYCAFRARHITSQVSQTPELETMLRFNIQQEFAVELPVQLAGLRIERPVIADGRTLPHKWIDSAGNIMKLDAATHGDDHFFPGPTDIAWDLAGVIVEWNLEAEAADFFLENYRRCSGDDPANRLPAYLLAYSIFRTAYCKMAAAASRGTPEYDRLLRDYHRYRQQAKALLGVPAESTDQAA